MDITKKRFKEIIKLNWFYRSKELWHYVRDDWVAIKVLKVIDIELQIVFWNWLTIDFCSYECTIWYMVIRNIINRLF